MEFDTAAGDAFAGTENLVKQSLEFDVTRRDFLGAAMVAPLTVAGAAEEWIELFDGEELERLAAKREQGVVEGC